MTTKEVSTGVLNEREAQSLADVGTAVRERTSSGDSNALTGDSKTPAPSAASSINQVADQESRLQRNLEHIEEPRPGLVQGVSGELTPELLNSKDVLVLLRALIVGVERVRQAVIRPPRSSQGTMPIVIHRVNVAVAGTPIQGPKLRIPAGHKVLIRQRNHAGTPVGYIAFDRPAIEATGDRIEFGDGDKLEFHLDSLDQVWFDADTADTAFELIVTR